MRREIREHKNKGTDTSTKTIGEIGELYWDVRCYGTTSDVRKIGYIWRIDIENEEGEKGEEEGGSQDRVCVGERERTYNRFST